MTALAMFYSLLTKLEPDICASCTISLPAKGYFLQNKFENSGPYEDFWVGPVTIYDPTILIHCHHIFMTCIA